MQGERGGGGRGEGRGGGGGERGRGMIISFADDDNRVSLKPIENIPSCQHEYINACYMNVSLVCMSHVMCMSCDVHVSCDVTCCVM